MHLTGLSFERTVRTLLELSENVCSYTIVFDDQRVFEGVHGSISQCVKVDFYVNTDLARKLQFPPGSADHNGSSRQNNGQPLN